MRLILSAILPNSAHLRQRRVFVERIAVAPRHTAGMILYGISANSWSHRDRRDSLRQQLGRAGWSLARSFSRPPLRAAVIWHHRCSMWPWPDLGLGRAGAAVRSIGHRLLAALRAARPNDVGGRAAPRFRSQRADGAGAREPQYDGGDMAWHHRGIRAGQYLCAGQRVYLAPGGRYRQPRQSRPVARGDHGSRTGSSDRAGGGNAGADAGLAGTGQGQSRSGTSHMGPR